MRGLLEVLRNTNSPNGTNFYFIRLIRVRFLMAGFGVYLNYKEHELSE